MESIARVYGESLFDVALSQGKIDQVREQLGQFADAVVANDELSLFLFSPYFSGEEKKDGLVKIIDGAEPIVLNFLQLLAEKHRLPAVHRIRRDFEARWAEHNKLLPVTVTSAIDLTYETVGQIASNIEQQTGRTVQLERKVDDNILGGLIVQVGNMVLDASIRNRLEQLRKQVSAAAA